MDAETKNMIDHLVKLFNARERLNEMSRDYATMTWHIQMLENTLIARGVDTAAILFDLAGM